MEQTSGKQTAIYLRVSTGTQDTDNQMVCVQEYCDRYGLTPTKQISDQTSSSVPWRLRGIGTLIETGEPGSMIIVSEVSRLARSTLECLEIFKEAADARITIACVKNGLTMDGGMQSKIVGTVIGLAAEIEREMIRARTTEALARRRSLGLPMGRPKGAKSPSKLEKRRNEIEELLMKKVGRSSICKIMGVSRGTLARALESWEAQT